MIVTAAIVWANERPEDLYRGIKSVSVIADRVVALDGGYRRYPWAKIRSSDAEVEAIRSACSDGGMECLVLQPDRLWAGQVEKRNYLIANATVGSDWIAVLDADWVFSGDREAARAFLENSEHDVVAGLFRTPTELNGRLPYYKETTKKPAHTWHLDMAKTEVNMAHLFNVKKLIGLQLEAKHWWYYAYVNGQRIWVWGNNGTLPQGVIPAPYAIDHMHFFRTEDQIRASRAFLNDRKLVVAQTGQEDDMPGLFPPNFDYDTMPND